MSRKKTRLYPLQLPVAMVEHHLTAMSDGEWDLTYGDIFLSREKTRDLIGILNRNRRPFIVIPLQWAVYERAMELAKKEVSDGKA